MRNRFADVMYDLGRQDDRLCIVVADISPAGSIQKFREEFPDRFINTGVAEQAMIGMAAGMASRGLRPIAYTIATFTLYRPFEFVRDDICYQNLPVGLVGVGGGVTYSTLGGTHHAMEDIAIAGALPNMAILTPSDPEEAEAATRWMALEATGPSYLRLGRAGEPVVTADADEPWRFGKIRRLRGGGADVAVLSYGPIMGMAIDVADALKADGKSVSLYSAPTLKPLDEPGLARILESHAHVVVVEETTPRGALGQDLKRIAWEIGARTRIDAFHLRDAFVHCYGSHADLLAAHGLSTPRLLERVRAEAA